MAKLIVEIDHKFSAGPFNGDEGPLTTAAAKKLVNAATPADFSLSIGSVSKEGYAEAGFNFPVTGLAKGGTFDYTFDWKKVQVDVAVSGTLTSIPMRSGVDSLLKKVGSKLDLRLFGFCYKLSKWSGFEAGVIGQPEEELHKWFRVTTWRLK